MANGTAPFEYPFPLTPDNAVRVRTILTEKIPSLEIIINSDRSTYPPHLAAVTAKDQVLMIIRVPRETNMPEFWKQLVESQSAASVQREKSF